MSRPQIPGRKKSGRPAIGLALIFGLLSWSFAFQVPWARADTPVSGPIFEDTTWTLAGSPYVAVGSVQVLEDVTLTIEPGVEVRFDADKALQIDGELIAQGTEVSPITFTANGGASPGDWGYVRFTDSSIDATFDGGGNYLGGSIMKHCIVEYGGDGAAPTLGAVWLENAHPFIQASTVRYNAAAGVSVENVDGVVHIADSSFHDNAGDGLYSGEAATGTGGGLTLTGSHSYANQGKGLEIHSSQAVSIEGCDVSSNLGGGIMVEGRNGDFAISSCNVTGNQESGISIGGRVDAWASASLTDCEVSDNVAYRAAGLWLGYVTATVDECAITDNTATGYFGGVWVAGATVSISGSEIGRNSALAGSGGGIHIDQGGPGAAHVTITDSLVYDNDASGKGGGIATSQYYGQPVTLVLDRTIVAGNEASDHGGGIWAFGTFTATRSAIVHNVGLDYSGLSVTAGLGGILQSTFVEEPAAERGASATAALYVEGQPVLHNNNLLVAGAPHTLYNGSPVGSPDLDAEYNWWGTTDPLEISARIYDWFDDDSLGIVDYYPWLGAHDPSAPISPPTGVEASAGEDWIALSWDANPEGDVAGYKVYYDTDPGFPYTGTGAVEGDSPIDVGNTTSFTLHGLPPATYYVAVSAYDVDADGLSDWTDGTESWFSLEAAVDLPQPPAVGSFAPNGGSGAVGQWAQFTTTYSDPNGYQDIQWAFFFLDRVPPLTSGGLAVAYNRPANLLWVMGASPPAFCRPGQSAYPHTAYATLSCRHTTVSGAGDTLTVKWVARPEQCFVGGCGQNTAAEYVIDAGGLYDVGAVGTWTLNPVGGGITVEGPAAQFGEVDGEQMRVEVEAWLAER